MSKALIACSLWMVMGPAAGADWDHDANIRSAVDELVASYRLGGSIEMQKVVGSCYGRVELESELDDRLRRLEYCAGMDFAAYHLDARDVNRKLPSFFEVEQVVGRVGQVSNFVRDPTASHRIIRAWSHASQTALSDLGF